MTLSSLLFALPAAFLLDLLIGDPKGLPHPIRWMGKWIETWEPYFRKLSMDLTASGSLFAISLVCGTWLIAWVLLQITHLMHEPFYTGLQIVLIYYSLSVRSLYASAMEVYRALKSGSLSESKEKLSRIVGRDVEALDTKGVIRAAVETVAENLVDGVLSPLFFATIGGAPLAMAYKMVNTLDSMVGYPNERYRYFGWTSAKADDVANVIPARMTALIFILASFILRKNWRRAWKVAWTYEKVYNLVSARRLTCFS